MTMTFSQHESIAPNGAFDYSGSDWTSPGPGRDAKKDDMHILQEKLRVPATRGLIERPRIDSLLTKSAAQFPATLITGRAGTGKTALAASFAKKFESVGWYTLESTDASWPVFSAYFSACLPTKPKNGPATYELSGLSQAEIGRFLLRLAARLYGQQGADKSLIVLDDIHHIFDAAWFDDFFNLLLYSLPMETHLLLLCRSKPPSPLWRLRSKQMLNVIDEKVIAFNTSETEELFAAMSLPAAEAREAHRQSFGRISKLLQFAAV